MVSEKKNYSCEKIFEEEKRNIYLKKENPDNQKPSPQCYQSIGELLHA
jgi:hypothetical protein